MNNTHRNTNLVRSATWLSLCLMTLLLAACGNNMDGSDDFDSGATALNAGIAVDPYIVNARFEEVAPDGRVLQPLSSKSNANGRFYFADSMREGSLIRMKPSSRGQHGSIPYTGLLKRRITASDAGELVVSPLTTVLANGMSEARLLELLASAGLTGLTTDQLDEDPMRGLHGASAGIEDADLHLLHANMALNTLMLVHDDFEYAGETLSISLAECVALSRDTLNAADFNTLSGTLSAELGGDFIFDDLAAAAVEIQHTVATQVRQELATNGSVDPTRFALLSENALQELPMLARANCAARLNDLATGGNGEALFAAACAACHSATGAGDMMDLAGDGALLSGRFSAGASHNGQTLTAEEIAAIGSYLDNSSMPSPPPAPVTGAELYAAECQGCHGSLTANDIFDPSAAGISAAIAADLGGMGYLSLSSEEIDLISEALTTTTTTPSDPVPERTGSDVYDIECAVCHLLGDYDPSGSIDLAGMGTSAATKVAGGHGGSVSDQELTALSTWLDTFQASDPYAGSCTSCHGQPPASGAHEVHVALNGVGTDCAACHAGAGHNGGIDLAFPATWDAKSGSASSNGSNCATTRCHGGQTTPDWNSGTLNVATQCSSCHEFGTAEYNSYASGEHRKHVVDKRFACSSCHDTTKLASGHFDDLSTISFEQSPAATIKSSLSYSGGTCQTAGCHGSESW